MCVTVVVIINVSYVIECLRRVCVCFCVHARAACLRLCARDEKSENSHIATEAQTREQNRARKTGDHALPEQLHLCAHILHTKHPTVAKTHVSIIQPSVCVCVKPNWSLPCVAAAVRIECTARSCTRRVTRSTRANGFKCSRRE